ncbi:MAG: hypothetical protein CVV32_10750 [Methanomicrobiales archaeon HGW-Methanomicrobiales-3]|jgi:hypothetical protein|nr:MAG: hypothetical protein CVV32_10750 [Methanomicrobiales archaeon HGW-Methanomicrobiales-3]
MVIAPKEIFAGNRSACGFPYNSWVYDYIKSLLYPRILPKYRHEPEFFILVKPFQKRFVEFVKVTPPLPQGEISQGSKHP